MPRRAPSVLPGVPLHITQRGIDRCPTFLENEDFAFYRWALGEARGDAGCAVHAYVLMTNHVHLLVTPDDASSAARLMCSIGRRYVRYFNHRYRRTGGLWEGRYRAVRVESAAHLVACSRYIEMNPVRAGLTSAPGAYIWSSYRRNGGGSADACIQEHPVYSALGSTREARCAAYRALFARPQAPEEIAGIRAPQSVRHGLWMTPYRQLVAELSSNSMTTR